MRSLWKGSISFGLVNIPVKLYAATERKNVKFHYLHDECKTPIRYLKWCEACNREVTMDEVVRGYEYTRGEYVVLRDEDFENIPVPTTRAVEIIDFVRLEEIDPIYYDKTYFLEPGEGAMKAYSLLRRAMKETGRIALAKVAVRARETIATVRVYQDHALVIETMFFPDEVRDVRKLEGIFQEPALSEREVELALQLVENLTEPFEPEKYTDDYRKALRDIIHKKIEGQEIAYAQRPDRAPVVDLMEALRASLEATEEERRVAARA